MVFVCRQIMKKAIPVCVIRVGRRILWWRRTPAFRQCVMWMSTNVMNREIPAIVNVSIYPEVLNVDHARRAIRGMEQHAMTLMSVLLIMVVVVCSPKFDVLIRR